MDNLIWSAPLERGELYILDGGLSTQLANYVKVPCEILIDSTFIGRHMRIIYVTQTHQVQIITFQGRQGTDCGNDFILITDRVQSTT